MKCTGSAAARPLSSACPIRPRILSITGIVEPGRLRRAGGHELVDPGDHLRLTKCQRDAVSVAAELIPGRLAGRFVGAAAERTPAPSAARARLGLLLEQARGRLAEFGRDR